MSFSKWIRYVISALATIAIGLFAAGYMVRMGLIVSPEKLSLTDYIVNFMITRTLLSICWLIPMSIIGIILLGWEEFIFGNIEGAQVVAFMRKTWPISVPGAVLFISQMMIVMVYMSGSILQDLTSLIHSF